MKIEEIRKLTTEELNKKLEEIKSELFNFRFQAATGSIEKPHQIGKLRKTVAKIKTVLRERELKESVK